MTYRATNYLSLLFYCTLATGNSSSSKPRGKSQGWTPGKRRNRQNRYPTVKKSASKPRKEQQKSA